jgi:single-strand DNA-binding protein|tara:strand:+ start:435 stop:857 length:423 start_codon:yes stop_codon:yes gene_type:complete
MLNKVMLIGNLGSDPELRQTDSGIAVCNLSIATTDRWTEDGEKKERTEWHRLVFWRRNAEIVAEFLTKGSRIWVEGKLQTRSFTNNQGVEKTQTEIVVKDMQMLGEGLIRPASGRGGGDANAYREASQTVSKPDDAPIPF